MKPYELSRYTVDIIRLLRGPENPEHSTRDELRWGTNGSLSVQPITGNWYNHETGEGGGIWQYLEREARMTNGVAVDWLKSEFGIEIEADTKRKRKTEPIAEYDYFDINDGRWVQKVRYDNPKTFAWRRLGENSKWIYKGALKDANIKPA